MQAIGVFAAHAADEPTALQELALPIPAPGDNDLLIQVDAISVNPADYRVRLRKQPNGRPDVLGWDAAGTVIACGPGAGHAFNPGDAVYYAGDILRPGCNSAYQLVDWRLVANRPKAWPAEAAAALPLTGLTAWEALFEQLGYAPDVALPEKQTLLIIGGAGGVGSIAIQLARLVPGLRVIATAARPQSADWCRQMGAEWVLDHSLALAPQLEEAGIREVHAVLLLNRPDYYFPILAQLIAPQGKLVNIVPFDQPPELNLLMQKSIRYSWTYMFTRSLFQTADMARQGEILSELTRLANAGRIRTTRSEHLGPITLANLLTAHRRLERGSTIGKLTLTGFSTKESQ
ncbi:zinc-binding alcohol dehydrogenase family protein [Pseudoduganella sp. FT93W]|uniref:Zinc-type alcohol dehydrogenase-like protein n=1 Tax=Duganella fentianensis TaxID=2692177 RepID=A0A845HZ74_9BURK|nr:zinc-binding alcohol dehydrogenase family protein [Duganella fentianensis]MYN44781.1 zinc-binding alcohol dehydrogenase family protein [Duganella fentianensis]